MHSVGFLIPREEQEADARFLTHTLVGTLTASTSETFWIVVIRATDHPI